MQSFLAENLRTDFLANFRLDWIIQSINYDGYDEKRVDLDDWKVRKYL